MTLQSLIRMKRLSFSYPGKNISILEEIDFDINKKDIIACIGPNGAGKTTLVKLILGLLHPSSGNIDRYLDYSEIGYVPQKYYIGKNFPGTVGEILSLGFRLNSGNKKVRRNRKSPLFSLFDRDQKNIIDLSLILNKRFIDLSGGEQQRVLIALALESSPRLLILDEPTAGIDAASRKFFHDLMDNLNRKGIAILLVTHDLQLPLVVNRVLYLDRENYIGTPEEIKSILAQAGVNTHFSPEVSLKK